MKKPLLPVWVALALVLSLSCRKENTDRPEPDMTLVSEARAYFSDHINTAVRPVPGSAATLGKRTAAWQNAAVSKDGKTVVVPLYYDQPQFLSLGGERPCYFAINNVARLLLTRDSAGHFDAQVQLRIPDSSFIKDPSDSFTGTIFRETWAGESLPTLCIVKDTSQRHSPGRLITVCTTITGYNYAPSNPTDVYYWTKTSCTSIYLAEAVDGGGGAGTGGGGGGGGTSAGGPSGGTTVSSRPAPTASSIRVLAPTSIITSVPDYLHCFTNSAGATYQVTVCVAQPVQGSRTPWSGAAPSDVMETGNPADVGHTFLVLTQSNAGTNYITRNIGFYPAQTIWPWSGNVKGAFNNDGLHHYNIAATFTVSAANFMNIIAYINSVQSTPYNLSTFNCTTFALNALEAGHIFLPRVYGYWPGGMGLDPGDLGEDIRLSKAPGIQKSTSDDIHNNMGSCN